jgi:hypothetical protein
MMLMPLASRVIEDAREIRQTQYAIMAVSLEKVTATSEQEQLEAAIFYWPS